MPEHETTFSNYQAGRDMVFEIYQSKARELVLHWARQELEFGSLLKGGEVIGTWPKYAQFKNNSNGVGIVDIVLDSPVGIVSKTAKLDFIKSEFNDRELPIVKSSNAYVSYIDIKKVDSNNISVGFTLNKSQYKDDKKWFEYKNTLLLGTNKSYDWSFAIGGEIIIAAISEKLVGSLVNPSNGENTNINITEANAAWKGDEEVAIVVKGKGYQTNQCNWDLNFAFWIEMGFVISSDGDLWITIINANVSPEGFSDILETVFCDFINSPSSIIIFVAGIIASLIFPGGVIGGIVALGKAVGTAYGGYETIEDLEEYTETVANEISIKNLYLNLGSSTFSLTSSKAIAIGRELIIEKAGIRIFGTFSSIEKAPPKLKLSKEEIIILESPKTFGTHTNYHEFAPVSLGIKNIGESTLWFSDCRIDTNNNFKIKTNNLHLTADHTGTSLKGLPHEFLGTTSAYYHHNDFMLEASYHGSITSNQETVLKIMSNDFKSWPTEIPVKAIVTGEPILQVDQYPIEIRVANTKSGMGRKALIGYCEEVDIPDELPKGSVRIYNNGKGPLFIESININTYSEVLQLEFLSCINDLVRIYDNKYVIAPSGFVRFGIRFFPVKAGVMYKSSIEIKSNAKDMKIPVNAIVETLPGEYESPFGINNESLKYKVDLYRERICLAAEGFILSDILKNNFKLPPLSPSCDDTIHVAFAHVQPTGPEMEITMGNHNGEVYAHFSSNARPQLISIDYELGSIDRNNDYIISYSGINRQSCCKPTASIGMKKIEKIGEVKLSHQVNSFVSLGGWVYVALEKGIKIIDWRIKNQPKQCAFIEDISLSSINFIDGFLVGISGKRLNLYHIITNDKIEFITSINITEFANSMTILGENIFILNESVVISYKIINNELVELGQLELPWQPLQITSCKKAIYVIGTKAIGSIKITSKNQLKLADAIPLEASFNSIIKTSSSIILSSNEITNIYTVDDDYDIQHIGYYRKKYWGEDFVIDSYLPRLYKINKESFLEMWKMSPVKLDRSQFPDLLELKYQPPSVSE